MNESDPFLRYMLYMLDTILTILTLLIHVSVSNRKMKGLFDDAIFEEARACQLLDLAPDFGFHSLNINFLPDPQASKDPKADDPNTSAKEIGPGNASDQAMENQVLDYLKVQKKNTESCQPAPIPSSSFYGSADNSSLATPKKTTEAEDMSTSTPNRQSLRLLGVKVKPITLANISGIQGGGGDANTSMEFEPKHLQSLTAQVHLPCHQLRCLR